MRTLAVVGVAASAGAGGLPAAAVARERDGQVFACYSERSARLSRSVDESCRAGSALVSWNVAQPNTGTQGPQGPQGKPGAQGSQGKTGPQGPQGPQGKTGPQGPQGKPGAQGSQGKAGAQGSQGKAGSQGSQGKTGSQGSQGKTGSQGSQGKAGSQGSQGKTGSQGSQGKAGGPQGPRGDTGPSGAGPGYFKYVSSSHGVGSTPEIVATLTPPPGLYQVDFAADTLVGEDHAEFCQIEGASAGGLGFTPTPPTEVGGGTNGVIVPIAMNGIVSTIGSRSSLIEVVCKTSGPQSTLGASVFNIALTADQLTEAHQEGSTAKLDRRPLTNRFAPSRPGRLAREWLKKQGR